MGDSFPEYVSWIFATPTPITSPRWIEPDESLEPGEYLLGGSTSTNLARGRLVGYGLFLTNRRIIGVKRKGFTLILTIAGIGLILAYLALEFLYFHNPFSGFSSLLLPAVDPASRYLTQRFGEKFLSRSDRNISRQLKRKRDFEAWRDEISALHLGKTSNKAWRLDIVFKDPEKKEARIKITGRKHYQIIRDLVEQFSRIQPTFYFREY